MGKILIVAIIFLLQGVAYSAEEGIKAPHFRLQGVQGTNSGLSMWCFGKKPYNEIDCAFTQIFINAIPTEKTAFDKKELVAESEKFTQDDIDIFKGEGLDKFTKSMKSATSEQKLYMQNSQNIMNGLKDAKEKNKITKAMSDILDFQGSTCTITEENFDRHFTRISNNKWLYNPGPVGLCNVVRISTLENTPEFPSLWTFTEKTEAFDNSIDICKESVGTPKTYIASWDTPRGFKFEQCKYIKIGN